MCGSIMGLTDISEAMSSGSILIVDNRGGWQQMVIHGKTGWLCNSPQDFIYYASKMAYEPELRKEMMLNAKERCSLLGGLKESMSEINQRRFGRSSVP